jgi:hypothetical protein
MPAHCGRSAGGAEELGKLELVREELDAHRARLFFFDRTGFSPRLRELAAQREDVRLVLAGDLA